MSNDEPVSTKRLVEILFANFMASGMAAAPVGFIVFYLSGGNISYDLIITWILGFPVSWGLLAAGRAWQRERTDVDFPSPIQTFFEALGVDGKATEFVNVLYLPGVQIPECH